MDEEEKKPTTPEDAGKGSEPKAATLVDEANSAAERLEKANERKAELLRQEEELAAKKALGGRSEAGAQAVKPKKLSDTEYAEALERGEVNPLEEDGITI